MFPRSHAGLAHDGLVRRLALKTGALLRTWKHLLMQLMHTPKNTVLLDEACKRAETYQLCGTFPYVE